MEEIRILAEQEELQRIALKDLGDRYQVYRFENPRLEKELKDSLRRHGQLTAIVVCREGSQYQVLDGFKRLRACEQLAQIEYLEAKVMRGDGGRGKAAMLCLNRERRGLCMVEEGLILRAMCQEEGLSQQAVACLVNRHPSWVCRRLALSQRLHEEVVAHLKLGLIRGSLGRELEKLPCGNQPPALGAIERHRLNYRETAQLVNELLRRDEVDAATAEACAQAIIQAKKRGQSGDLDAGEKRPRSLVQLLRRLEHHCLEILAFGECCPLASSMPTASMQVAMAGALEAAERVAAFLRKGGKLS